jgi:outer membrane biosynthesis protein TonB
VRREEEAPRAALLKKLAIPTGIFVGAMIVLSIYLAKRGDKPTHTAANVTVVHAPPPAPVVQPIDTPAPSVQPIEEVKPTEQPVVAEEAKPTFEPTVPEPTVAEVNTPVEEQVAEKPVAKKSSKAKRAAKRTKAPTRVAVAEQPKAAKQNLGGNGALSVSSSPAREVWVDGRNTKSMTPQRLTLKPGTHNITLFDKKTRSAKTFQVEIKPNEVTRVAKKY